MTQSATQKLSTLGLESVDLGVVLGSGLGAALPPVRDRREISYEEVPGARIPSVAGHAGSLVFGHVHGCRILASQGRVHQYEGASFDDVCFFVRLMGSLGARHAVLTQAAGAANPRFDVPGVMVVRDQLNLTGRSYPVPAPAGPIYSPRLRNLLRSVASRENVPLAEGVLAGFLGPAYETPAEVRLARSAGAQSLTMSTIPEALMAASMGMEVLGLSVLTNRAPHGGGTIRHQAVVRNAEAGADVLRTLLEGLCARLGRAAS